MQNYYIYQFVSKVHGLQCPFARLQAVGSQLFPNFAWTCSLSMGTAKGVRFSMGVLKKGAQIAKTYYISGSKLSEL